MFSRLIWLALGAFTVGTEGFVIAGLLPEISTEADISMAQAGSLVTAFSLAYALGTPILATLLGGVDRRYLLAGTMALFAAGNLTAALASGFAALLIARIVMAVAAGLYAATAQATAIALSPPDHRARAISVVVGGTTVAVALGAPIGALLATVTGWRGTFAAIAVLSACTALAVLVKLPGNLRGSRIPLRQRAAVAARPGMLPLLATTFLCLTGGFTVFTYIAPFAVDGAGLSASLIPAVLLAFGIGSALGNIVGGQAADRFGPRPTLIFSTLAVSVVLIAMSVVVKTAPANLAGPILVALTVPWGIFAWMVPPTQASRIVALDPESAPVSLSLNASVLYLGVAFGAFVGGEIMTLGHMRDLGFVAALFPLLALLIVLATGRGATVMKLRLRRKGCEPLKAATP
ncbi:MFS transporter [Microvirga puerhi]|uniref:MFS transporter n=1 Tax=Microvirga puerhi TaxID=2876078 RepID=A0ABS7VMT7_9HYPH|nr:MFS transporter [Microvirga puerhi]MBZ6076302.1 MFS transporter [Microvirga puerhi]